MIREIEMCGITNIVEYDYFMVDVNLDMRADVEMAFELDGKEYKTEFKYEHRNEVNKWSVMGKTLEDIEEIKQGNRNLGIYLTVDEVIEDIVEIAPRYMYKLTDDKKILRRMEEADITVYLKLKNVEINEKYDIADSIKEAYKICTTTRELDVVDAVVQGIKNRTGSVMGLFSIEMYGSSNRIVITGTSARVENAILKRRKGGLCLYSKCGYMLLEEAEYTCLLINDDDYELVRYKGGELDTKDLYELFKTDDDRHIRKLIIME